MKIKYYEIENGALSDTTRKRIKTSLRIRNKQATIWAEIVETEQCEGYTMETNFINFKWLTEFLCDVPRQTKNNLMRAETLYCESTDRVAENYANKMGVIIKYN